MNDIITAVAPGRRQPGRDMIATKNGSGCCWLQRTQHNHISLVYFFDGKRKKLQSRHNPGSQVLSCNHHVAKREREREMVQSLAQCFRVVSTIEMRTGKDDSVNSP
jgi:hypothetical protein